jgi:hypothetical protein
MIEIIPFKKIDPKKWNTCVANSKRGNIFGLYESISEACSNWVGVVLNDYDAVLAVPVKKKLGLTYSWHPQFMGPLGVYGGTKKIQKEMLNQLSSLSWWIKMYYWQERKAKKLRIKDRVYQVLSLKETTIGDIRSRYNENTKRNIKKADKLGLTVTRSENVNMVIKIFKENKGGQIDNIDDNSYILLKKLMDHWTQTKNGYVTEVYQDQTLLAIGYFLVWKNTVIYYKGAVTEEGKTAGAMHYLIDHEIEQHAGKLSRFDFGGSNTTSVARFYKGFGGVDKEYFEYEFKKFKIL